MTYASFSDYREIRWYAINHEIHEGHEKTLCGFTEWPSNEVMSHADIQFQD